MECGYRGEYESACPECGSTNLLTGYGDDTTILISSDNISNDITYSTNVDSVKNCFKLVAGDDLMTATITNCNPNGSGYIWYIPDSTKEDMSDELVSALNKYDTQYDYYQNEHVISIDSNLVSSYNDLVEKYSSYSNEIATIPVSIIGYPQLMNTYYGAIDFELFLRSSLMPNIELQETNARNELYLQWRK